MIETLRHINIQGGFFAAPATLEPNTCHLNIIFGRNGSGKSSIAAAYRVLAQPDGEPAPALTVSTDRMLTEDEKKKIKVFDEQFIRSNTLLAEGDGLKAIVMLGAQVDLDRQIREQQALLNEQNADLVTKRNDNYNRHDPANVLSPEYHAQQIRNHLAQPHGWSEQNAHIRGNAFSRITETLFNELKDLNPTEDLATLKATYVQQLRIFDESSGGSKIPFDPKPLALPFDADALHALMSTRVEEPVLDERDHKILQIVNGELGGYIHQVHPVFDNPAVDMCPLCFRPVDAETRSSLFAMVERVLNRQAEEYLAQLRAFDAQANPVHLMLPADVPDSCKMNLRACQNDLTVLNQEIADVKTAITERKSSLYTPEPHAFDLARLKTLVDALNHSIQRLGADIANYNHVIDERENVKAQLLVLLKKIAALECRESFQAYTTQKTEQTASDEAITAQSALVQATTERIRQLNDQKNQVSIAKDFINNALAYVFYSKQRMQLEPGEGFYRLKVNGEDVPLKNISVGERNAIALCYFFASMFQGEEDAHKYEPERLIVIDDPVSSFDFSNRVGILSFLRWQLEQLFNGCKDSRVIIMSHDLRTVFDLQKVGRDIADNSEAPLKYTYTSFELVNKALENLPENKNRSEYRRLIRAVYDYATAADPAASPYDAIIGNQMRKVIESYSSFMFNCGIENTLHTRMFTMGSVPEAKQRYYRNFMSRLVLHGESHTVERVYTLDDFEEFFDSTTKQITAKSLLMLFYYTNKSHLESYLEPAQIATLAAWSAETFDQI